MKSNLIREPKEVDFTVDGRELTAEEEQKISEYIQKQKTARLRKSTQLQTKRISNTSQHADTAA